MWDLIPSDIFAQILDYFLNFTPQDLLNVKLTCKEWNKFCLEKLRYLPRKMMYQFENNSTKSRVQYLLKHCNLKLLNVTLSGESAKDGNFIDCTTPHSFEKLTINAKDTCESDEQIVRFLFQDAFKMIKCLALNGVLASTLTLFFEKYHFSIPGQQKPWFPNLKTLKLSNAFITPYFAIDICLYFRNIQHLVLEEWNEKNIKNFNFGQLPLLQRLKLVFHGSYDISSRSPSTVNIASNRELKKLVINGWKTDVIYLMVPSHSIDLKCNCSCIVANISDYKFGAISIDLGAERHSTNFLSNSKHDDKVTQFAIRHDFSLPEVEYFEIIWQPFENLHTVKMGGNWCCYALLNVLYHFPKITTLYFFGSVGHDIDHFVAYSRIKKIVVKLLWEGSPKSQYCSVLQSVLLKKLESMPQFIFEIQNAVVISYAVKYPIQFRKENPASYS